MLAASRVRRLGPPARAAAAAVVSLLTTTAIVTLLLAGVRLLGPGHISAPIKPVGLPVAAGIVSLVRAAVIVEAVTGLDGLAVGVARDVLLLLVEVKVAPIVGLHDLFLPSTSPALAATATAAAAMAIVVTAAGGGRGGDVDLVHALVVVQDGLQGWTSLSPVHHRAVDNSAVAATNLQAGVVLALGGESEGDVKGQARGGTTITVTISC